jgi:hypothetical protein
MAGRRPVNVTMNTAAVRARRLANGQPLVSKVDSRAAVLLGVDVGRLAVAVEAAGLVPWGQHSDGNPVYRWRELVALAKEVRA